MSEFDDKVISFLQDVTGAMGLTLDVATEETPDHLRLNLTGEGADEWLVGYPWYKAAKIIQYLDFIPGLRLSDHARRGFLRLKILLPSRHSPLTKTLR